MIRFGIPAESTGQIIPFSRVQNSLCETAGSEVLISLPVLYQESSPARRGVRQTFTTPHGLVLKLSVSGGKKIVLLTPKIEKDMEIQDENVHRLPDLFSGAFKFIRGVFFNEENPVFILNPEMLTESVEKCAGSFAAKCKLQDHKVNIK